MHKNILVLGGSYFIGKKIALSLNDRGYKVSILNRGTKPSPSDDIEQIICDRNDIGKLKSVLKVRNFDYVIDVSWQDISWVEILCDCLNTDTLKTFIFISSSAVYDVEHLKIPYSENNVLSANKYWTFYGAGKIQAEEYYQKFFSDKNTNLVILRPPYIYGEDNYAQRESLIFRQIAENHPVIIPKSNLQLQFIYVEDLAKIVSVFLDRNNTKVEIYNVGNHNSVTALEWVQTCADAAKKPIKIIQYDYQASNRNIRDFFPFFDYDNVLDASKIKNIYNDETPFEVGLANSFQWFSDNKSMIAFKENVDKNINDIIANTRNR